MLCSSFTDRHESENRGHPFRVSRFLSNFPSTYHQGAVQHIHIRWTNPGSKGRQKYIRLDSQTQKRTKRDF